MAIRTVVTRGYGNGTFDGTIALVVTRGYAIGVPAPPVIPPARGAGILDRLRRRELPALLVAFQSKLVHFTATSSLTIRGRVVQVVSGSAQFGVAKSSLRAKAVPTVPLMINFGGGVQTRILMAGKATPAMVIQAKESMQLNFTDPDLVAEAAIMETERLLEEAVASIAKREADEEEEATLRLLEVL